MHAAWAANIFYLNYFLFAFLIIVYRQDNIYKQHKYYCTYGCSWENCVVIFLGWLTYESGSWWVNEVVFSIWSWFDRRDESRISGWTNADGFLVTVIGDEFWFDWDIDGTG